MLHGYCEFCGLRRIGFLTSLRYVRNKHKFTYQTTNTHFA